MLSLVSLVLNILGQTYFSTRLCTKTLKCVDVILGTRDRATEQVLSLFTPRVRSDKQCLISAAHGLMGSALLLTFVNQNSFYRIFSSVYATNYVNAPAT